MQKTLLTFLLLYGIASLLHFIHNAEFLADYPNLPASWSRVGIYLVWLALSMFGVTGWFLMIRGFPRLGLLLLGFYAAFGIDSLGHYVIAPISDHTFAMNATILVEVTTALLVLVIVIRQMAYHAFQKTELENGT